MRMLNFVVLLQWQYYYFLFRKKYCLACHQKTFQILIVREYGLASFFTWHNAVSLEQATKAVVFLRTFTICPTAQCIKTFFCESIILNWKLCSTVSGPVLMVISFSCNKTSRFASCLYSIRGCLRLCTFKKSTPTSTQSTLYSPSFFHL